MELKHFERLESVRGCGFEGIDFVDKRRSSAAPVHEIDAGESLRWN